MEKINLSEEYFVKNILPLLKNKNSFFVALLVDCDNKKLLKKVKNLLNLYLKEKRGIYVNKGILVLFDVNYFYPDKYVNYFDYIYEVCDE